MQFTIVGRSPRASKFSTKPGVKTGELVENVYSNAPTASHSKASNDYEVLPEKIKVPVGLADSSSLLVMGKTDSERSLPQHSATASKSATSIADILEDDSDGKGSPIIGKSTVQVYGRSMYANLEKADIEVPQRAPDLAVKHPSQLKTSTPIKADSKVSSKPGYV